ncbi:hypothetical protein BAU15_08770 [Enterococcus sp. JM4C]|uniref:bacterial Ig-like domain-containing protein n=1 Tax=Candidatus Enterococcus huntleyi TaxID=1857217 RepID=UPI0013794441|nr:bacterial Ig-like domain-containing protein [Enterococcus sp. JM4C]KAF1296729.1 hypothetical protein BAU15_08770 [Enterococcus sp. JM4C]
MNKMNKKISTYASILLISSQILSPISAFAETKSAVNQATEVATKNKDAATNKTLDSAAKNSTTKDSATEKSTDTSTDSKSESSDTSTSKTSTTTSTNDSDNQTTESSVGSEQSSDTAASTHSTNTEQSSTATETSSSTTDTQSIADKNAESSLSQILKATTFKELIPPTDGPYKMIEGKPEHEVFLQSSKVLVENELINGRIQLGGQYNDTFNISTIFYPSEFPAGNKSGPQTIDGVIGLGGRSSAPAIMLRYQSGQYHGGGILDIPNSSFKVIGNGVDYSDKYALYDNSSSGFIGVRMKDTYPDGMFFPIGTGLEVEFHFAFLDNYGSRDIDHMDAFRFMVNDDSPYTPNIMPTWESGRGPVMNGLKVVYGYAPEILGVDDEEIPLGQTFDDLDGVSATDKHDGDLTPILKVLSNDVDTSKIGTYTVTYEVTDSDAHVTTAKRTIHVVSEPVITANDKTVRVGVDPTTVDWLDGVSATDPGEGDLSSQVTVDYSQVDFNTAGDYPATYSVTNTSDKTATKDITVHVIDNQQSITGSDVTKYVGDALPKDAEFKASATDKDGKDLTVTIDQSKVDMSKPGDYEVLLTTADGQTKTVYVHVKENKAAVKVHSSEIYVGDPWKAEDNFESAVDKDGKAADFSQITVDESKKDTSKAGSFDVTYTLDGVTATATITVKAKKTAVNVSNSEIYVGDPWKAEDNFDSAVDKDGNPVDFSQVTFDDSKKDTSKVGTFDVTYTYDGVTATATITVKAKKTAVNVHNSEIYVGDNWTAKDNFDSVVDKAGNKSTDFSKVTFDDSKKDTSKVGTFDVTYTYEGVTAKATITVKDKQTAVNVHNSEIYVGDSWTAKDNFNSATSKGKAVDFSKITVDDSKKDTSKAGSFDVTYTYDGVTATATITVKAKKTAVNVHNSEIYVGDSWTAKDNFDSVVDKDGNKSTDFSKVTFDDSKKDTSKAGTFDVTYTYEGVTATATVTVKDKQTAVNVHNSEIYVGDNWTAKDNFDSVVDKDGNKSTDFSKVTFDDSQADTSKAGSFEVTYTFEGVTATATIIVKDKQTAVNVHNSEIYVGDNWTAKDNFDSVLDKDGNKITDFSKVTFDDSQADTSKAGSFEVTYTFEGVTATATIIVKDKQTAVNVHNSEIYVGDNWTAKDNFDSVVDKDGNKITDFSKVTFDDSQADTSKAGSFEVTYTFEGVTATATITVKDKETVATVTVHDSTIYVGDEWTAADNFDSAIDKDGNKITDINKITVDDSQADTSKTGTFEVTYTLDGVTATATITVKDKQTAVTVHDSTIYVGDEWTAADNFDSAIDKDGNKITDISKITVDDSKKDTSKAGTFEVTYTLDGVTAMATITVKDKQTAVSVHDSTIYVGDEWKAADNFDSAIDKDGNRITDISKITVDDSKKDTSKAGTFEVTYTLDGVTATATITVKDKQTAVSVHDSTIYVGDEWKAADNFDSAIDKDGNRITDISKITVDDSKKDTSKAGTFEVTYTLDGVTATATITVKDKQTAVTVHDSTIYVGDEWTAADNFDSAIDKDGNRITDISKITVDDSKKDTSKAGTFEVTYTLDGVTATATITVKEKLVAPVEQAEVVVHYVDENGKEISKSISIKGQIGDSYKTSAKEIAGYVLVKEPKNKTGKFTKDNQKIVYVYAKEEKNSGKNTGNNTNAGTTKNNNTHKNVKKLPQTGEKIVESLPIVGGIAVFISGVLFFFKRKKND